jgi:hypothetical protein
MAGDMNMNDNKKHIWDNPKNVQILLWVFGACSALLLLIDAFIHRHLSFQHGELAYEGWFGFYPAYGFVACVVLVLVAKQMRKVVMRDEDYYD